MADDGSGTGALDEGTENAALGEALAAEHAAVWGYGVVGAAVSEDAREVVVASEAVHRDVRDRVTALLSDRNAEVADAKGAYTLPFPVLSEVDAAALAVVLEDGVADAWVRVLDQAAEGRAVGWRGAAGQAPVTSALPGLPPQ